MAVLTALIIYLDFHARMFRTLALSNKYRLSLPVLCACGKGSGLGCLQPTGVK
jgi:hypothetical protein